MLSKPLIRWDFLMKYFYANILRLFMTNKEDEESIPLSEIVNYTVFDDILLIRLSSFSCIYDNNQDNYSRQS